MKPRRASSSICIDSETREVYANGRRVRFCGDGVFEVFCMLWRKKIGGMRCSTIFNQLYQLRPDCDVPREFGDKTKWGIVKVMVHRMRATLAPIGVTIERVGWGDCCYVLKFNPDGEKQEEQRDAA